MKVIIVESPSKAKVIAKYLGNNYLVLSSGGHIRELPAKNGSVDTTNFSMKWELNSKGEKFLKDLKQKLKDADELLLATDPDREGEGIAWHIVDSLGKIKIPFKRVSFNAVTKKDILNAVENPRDIDNHLVNAYQSRLMIDYLMGFNLSPVLWRKLPGSRSAGRVQSVALRLLIERAVEIINFIIEEYWTIDGEFQISKSTQDASNLKCRLSEFEGQKLEKLQIQNEEQAVIILDKLQKDDYKIFSIEDSETKRNPNPPFNTSSMQQAAVNELNMRSVIVMKIAQELYEGINIGGETVGLITYMRTDSIAMNDDAIKECRNAINTIFGDKYVSNEIRVYKTKAKNAQESHEAIRPTDFMRDPQKIKEFLTKDQFNLYDLVWRRSIASQMSSGIFLSRNIKILGNMNKSIFSASGSKVVFDGFLKIMRSSLEDNILPDFDINSSVLLNEIFKDQHFTKPPANYNEASLVKKLEELGIGRPSTYARIFQVLTDRGYASYEGKSLKAEFKGMLVVYFLMEFFSKYVEYDFTANMENLLDGISNGSVNSIDLMKDFWKNFHEDVEKSSDIKIVDVLKFLQDKLDKFLFSDETKKICTKCSSILELRLGKFGPFIGCSNYTNKSCDYIKNIDEENSYQNNNDQNYLGELNDGTKVNVLQGPYGRYLKFSNADGKSSNIGLSWINENLSLEQAIFIKNLPLKLGNINENDVNICIGRFGPYIKHGDKMISIKKSINVFEINFTKALEILQSTEFTNKKPSEIKKKPKVSSSAKTTRVSTRSKKVVNDKK